VLLSQRRLSPSVTLVIYGRSRSCRYIVYMPLSSMVVSRDWQEISVLECILGSLHMDVAVEKDPQRAIIRLNKSKIDALIVDCDLQGTSQLFERLQRVGTLANTVGMVITRSTNGTRRMADSGALFAFEKPISVEQAVRTLSAARSMILDGRLRYHRAGLEVGVSLNCPGHKQTQGFLVNVSQGGMQIHTPEKWDGELKAQSLLQVSFHLPGIQRLKADAEIAWHDQRGNMGVRFVKIAPRQQRALQLWLARQYFAN